MVEHCLSLYSKAQKDMVYRVYITNMLQRLIRVHYKGEIPSYYDIISGGKKEETRTADEIKDDLKSRINKLGGR